MKRKIYKYDVKFCEVDIPSKPKEIIEEEEMDNLLKYLIELPKKDRRQELIKSEKVIFLDEFIKKKINGKNIYYLKMVSLKYNQVREVLNIDTLQTRGRIKGKRDGDKEYNHIVLIENKGIIKAAFEYNYYGLTELKTIISYLNDMSNNYFKSKKYDKYYYLECKNELNREFLEELNTAREITKATIVVEKERMGSSMFGQLANRNEIDSNVEIVFKRKGRKEYISKTDIENYYSNYYGKNGVHRIYIDGKQNNTKVRLDTEEMKEQISIDVAENVFGEVDSEILYDKLHKYLMGEDNV